MAKIFILKCPRCGNTMKYSPMKKTLEKKKKICVYCGKAFKVKDYIIRTE